MDLEIFMLSEISQSEKDKYQKISLICGTKYTDKENTNSSVDTWNRLTAVREEEVGRNE